jgi:hypothetical protein
VGTSYALARKVRRQAARLAPPEVARRSADRVRSALDDGRVAMQAREAELRRAYDPPAVRPLRSVPDS